ncbi:hypothetical protein EXIGLDRAFT_722905 [Exidia glandulosa HHB12029]|uniref:Secreted protein n=1 Tax=Exidia glandulosa HHB12029 TaxID=1314781 RepID=A0A165F247_EXIGL|nr:hypothetical protein EXIGLDRAFT_722905 [Exidia glandulosa HHB12029]
MFRGKQRHLALRVWTVTAITATAGFGSATTTSDPARHRYSEARGMSTRVPEDEAAPRRAEQYHHRCCIAGLD